MWQNVDIDICAGKRFFIQIWSKRILNVAIILVNTEDESFNMWTYVPLSADEIDVVPVNVTDENDIIEAMIYPNRIISQMYGEKATILMAQNEFRSVYEAASRSYAGIDGRLAGMMEEKYELQLFFDAFQ